MPINAVLEGINCVNADGKFLVAIFQHPANLLKFLFIINMDTQKPIISMVIVSSFQEFSRVQLHTTDIGINRVIIKNASSAEMYIELPSTIFNYDNHTLEAVGAQFESVIKHLPQGYLCDNDLKNAIELYVPHSKNYNLKLNIVAKRDKLLEDKEKINISYARMKMLKEKNLSTNEQLKEHFKVVIQNLDLFEGRLTEMQKYELSINKKYLDLLFC